MVVKGRTRPRGDKLRVVLTGGGTGGHVYPALAIHGMLARRDMVAESLYLGVQGRAEETIVPRQGMRLTTIHSSPYAGGSPFAKLQSLATITRGIGESLVAMLRFRPDLVVATGGYVSAPVIVAAFLLKPLLGLKIVVEEQNLVPGILNKVASLLADAVLVSFRESAYFIWSSRCVMAGYPLRPEYQKPAPPADELRASLGIPKDAFVILVTGGSMGSRSINRGIATAITKLEKIPGLLVVHAVGLLRTPQYDAVADTSGKLAAALGDRFDRKTMTARDENGREVYRGFEYLHNIVDYQRVADLVISRAGAGSLAEITALGKAALAIPKRGLPGDHQELNAIGLAENGAVDVLFEQRDLATGVDFVDPDELARRVLELANDPQRRERLAAAGARVSPRDPEARVVRTVQTVLDGGDLDLIQEIIEPPFVRFQRQFDNLIAHLDTSAGDGLYHRLYGHKIEEYLASSDYLTVNKGVKLIGSLRRRDLYPFVLEHYDRLNGFLRRNGLAALRKATEFEPFFVDLVVKGIADHYFETRKEAIALYNRFYREVNQTPQAAAIHAAILARVNRKLESFEVRAEAIRATVRFLPEDAFYATAGPYLTARNVRLREALLDAVEVGLHDGLLKDNGRVGRFISRMLVTTSQFTPGFRVRERFVHVVKTLEAER